MSAMIAQDMAMIVTERTKMGIEEISIPREIEADGYITRKQDLRSRPLERVTDNTANPTSECCYPRCEECNDYVSYKGANYCTVPMVITKQTWLLTTALITDLRRDIDEAREMVYDHILNENHRVESGNYSFSQANSGSVCFNCKHYDPKGYCNKHGITISPNMWCGKGEFKP